MQTYNKLTSFKVLCGLFLIVVFSITSFQQARAFEDIPGIDPYESAREAYRQGITAYDEGWYELAFPALNYAAKRKIIGAQLTVAKMYAQGIWVRQSHVKAFDIYEEIRQDNKKILTAFPRPKGAFLVAEAYVELAKYYNSGLAERGVPLDNAEAFRLFMIAARSLGSAEAQYELAKMYLSGRGVERNSRKAIRWLINADKSYNYPPAQALLGKIFWYGLGKRERRPIFALALLTKAKKHMTKVNKGWIEGLYNKAYGQASEEQRNKAERLVAIWHKKRMFRRRRKEKLIERYQPQNRDSLNRDWQQIGVIRRTGRKMTIREQNPRDLGQFQKIDTPLLYSGRGTVR